MIWVATRSRKLGTGTAAFREPKQSKQLGKSRSPSREGRETTVEETWRVNRGDRMHASRGCRSLKAWRKALLFARSLRHHFVPDPLWRYRFRTVHR
eukprot:254059-Rhodomonas_salina.2